MIREPESLLMIRFIDGLTRDGEMDAKVCSDGGICLWYSALCGKHRMSCRWSMDMRFFLWKRREIGASIDKLSREGFHEGKRFFVSFIRR